MKVVIIDTWSNMLDWAMRCQAWGHEVLWFDEKRKDGTDRLAGRGIVPKIVDYQQLRKKYIDWADLIVLPDNTKYLDMLEPFRQLGYPIFGPSAEAAKLELDRDYGQATMKKYGLQTIPSIAFHDYDDAAAYVKKHQTYLVSKPSGDANKVLSYVAKDAAELVYMLGRWKKNEKYRSDARKHGFILQEKKSGPEFAVTGVFGPGGWSAPWFENWENKKFLDGDLGPTTGEQGTLVMAVKKSKLADVALKPITKELEKLEYVGFVDISGSIAEDGSFWPFEYTMRPGWPMFHNIQSLLRGDPAQWMLDCIHGHDTMDVIYDTCSVSVVVSIPDYPLSKLTNKEVSGIPIYNAGDREHIRLCGAMLQNAPVQMGDKVVEIPCYVTTDDYVYVATGIGETITGARKSAYAAIKKVRIPNDPQYRLDIGKGRVVRQLEQVQRLGYAKGFRF